MSAAPSISKSAFHPAFGRWRLGIFLLMALSFLAPDTRAQASREYQLKAVFLFRLAQFVEWPTNSFQTTNDPVIIGVLGHDPFGEALDVAIRNETAHHRPLQARRFSQIEDAASGCHILFISRSEAPRVRRVIAALNGKSILTVSDIDDFVTLHNGMVRFATEENKIKLLINLTSAKAANLNLDGRLLRLADVVNRP